MPVLPEDTLVRISEVRAQCAKIKPLVTISCGTFNHENYIRDTLEGFIKQETSFPFVAIIHDDASSDGTALIVKEYAMKYPDIILPILESENQYSRGESILSYIMTESRKATGAEYYAFCEGDDYWTDPHKLQKQFAVLEQDHSLSIALNRVGLVDNEGNRLSGSIPPPNILKEGVVTLSTLMDEEFRKGHWTFHTSSFFIRKNALETYSDARESIFKKFPYGDMPLLLTCLLSGNGYFFTEEMGCYRVLSGGYNSSLKASPQKAIADFRRVAAAYRDFDLHTSMKYHKQLERAARRYEWRSMDLECPDRILWRLKPRYLPFLNFKGLIRNKFPKFFDFAKNIVKPYLNKE